MSIDFIVKIASVTNAEAIFVNRLILIIPQIWGKVHLNFFILFFTAELVKIFEKVLTCNKVDLSNRY